MNIALWIVQGLLAFAFGIAGQLKSLQYAKAAQLLPWVPAVPEPLVRLIGTSELLGALGVLLPWATGVRRGLTPLAAAGLAAIMLLAMAFHASRGEWTALPINLTLGALAAFVAWGRRRDLLRG
ncbi:MAG: DoxX family protein [bacterium]